MLYHESFPVISDFCPKPFGQFYHISTFRHTDAYKKCLIIPTKGQYMKKAIAWAFPKKSPFLNIFNLYFQKFKARGIWKGIKNRYRKLPQECPDLTVKSIGFDSCFTAFLILLIGFSFSFLIILIEFQKKNMNKSTLKQLDVSQDEQNKIEEKIKSHYDSITNLKVQLQNIQPNTNMN